MVISTVANSSGSTQTLLKSALGSILSCFRPPIVAIVRTVYKRILEMREVTMMKKSIYLASELPRAYLSLLEASVHVFHT